MSHTQDTGNKGEQFAAAWLSRNGHTVLECGYRSRWGEIDLITVCGDFICFVEVKTRRSGRLEDALAAVSFKKQKKIIQTALQYLQEHDCELQPRFDVVAVELNEKGEPHPAEYLPGAFDAQTD